MAEYKPRKKRAHSKEEGKPTRARHSQSAHSTVQLDDEYRTPKPQFLRKSKNHKATVKNKKPRKEQARDFVPIPKFPQSQLQIAAQNVGAFGESENQDAVKSKQHTKPLAAHLEFGSLSSREIRQMAAMDDQALVKYISQRDGAFLISIKSNIFLEDSKNIRCFVKILYKLVESKEDSIAFSLLAQIFGRGSGCEHFIFKLDMLIKTIPYERSSSERSENIKVLGHIVHVAALCIQRIPSVVLHSFPIYSISDAIQNLLNFGSDEEKAFAARKQDEVLDLNRQFQEHKEQVLIAAKPKPKVIAVTEEDTTPVDPPEHFTAVELLPKPEEINHCYKPFLRPNLVEGKYESWEHYLDVQFRLLREDFVGPLREGISNYVEGPVVTRGNELYVYQGVMLGEPVCLNSQIGFDLWFDASALRGINWDYTKRLINGSLLCLSTDDFENIIFVTVADRKPNLLSRGLVTVQFKGTVNGFEQDPQAVYSMVESVAYFEAYRHVLERLREVSRFDEVQRMPFKQYIVERKFDMMLSPLYVQNMAVPTFDLHGIVEMKTKKSSTIVNLTNTTKWPVAENTDLDFSQMEAMKAALTQDLSVIQGPPGTGKTYIGIKVVQTFLSNKKSWDPKKVSPILVVCYTNHALDQFLEGIKSAPIKERKPNITRIGGRCKTDELKSCVLYEKVSLAKERKSVPSSIYRPYADARKKMVPLKNKVVHCLNSIQQSGNHLLRANQLQHVMHNHHYSQVMTLNHRTKLPLEVWLGIRFLVITQTEEEETETNPTENTEEQALEEIGYTESPYDDSEVQRIQDDRLIDEDDKVLFKIPEVSHFEGDLSDSDARTLEKAAMDGKLFK